MMIELIAVAVFTFAAGFVGGWLLDDYLKRPRRDAKGRYIK